jgi:SAM-dependent methyltransferase
MIETRTTTACQICGTSTGNFVTTREMMFGTRERFTYFECGNCGCLQLLDIPDDLTPYYPEGYYSFSPSPSIPTRSVLRRWLNDWRTAGSIFGHNPLSWLLSQVRPGPDHSRIAEMLRPTGVRNLGAKILDVGCGAGGLLQGMADAGFRRLVGIDPFTTPRTDGSGRLRILATTIDQLQEADFDLVMSHHSLEHMVNQIDMLRQMRRVLKDDGVCLIRIPVASSEVWRRYRENWVELDPPRHLVVHTRRSFEAAANDAGFRLVHAKYDDSNFGYWGSELYLADISLTDPVTRKFRSPLSHFEPQQLAEFERLAQAANARQDGGRAAFYLRKA